MLLGKFISTKVSKDLSIIAYCFSEIFRCLCVVFSLPKSPCTPERYAVKMLKYWS